MRNAVLVILLIGLILASCSPVGATEEVAISPEVPEPSPTPQELTPPELAAMRALSANLGFPLEEVILVSTEAVDWPDGCLGVVDAGLACASVITPGFSIILEANGRQVEYRTNEDGTHIRAATVALTWKREGGIAGFCDFMTIYLSGEVHSSSCNRGQYIEEPLSDIASAAEMKKLDEWLNDFGMVNIDASDPKGVSDRMVVTLTLIGTGSQKTLSRSEEKALLDFAQELNRRVYQ